MLFTCKVINTDKIPKEIEEYSSLTHGTEFHFFSPYAIITANVLDQNVSWQKDIYIKLRDFWLILVSQSWLETTRVSLWS